MPTVLRVGSLGFSFFASDCAEKPHIHVHGPDGAAKFWLEPVILFTSAGFSRRQLREIERIIIKHQVFLLEQWDLFCGS